MGLAKFSGKTIKLLATWINHMGLEGNFNHGR